MKKTLIFFLTTILCLVFILSGCVTLKYDKVYYEYNYVTEKDKFSPSGLTATFFRDGAYEIKYVDLAFNGKYLIDESRNMIKTELFEEDLADYKELNRALLIEQGYSESEAKTMSDKMTLEDRYYIYKSYVYKPDSIKGAKAFQSKGNFEGIYTLDVFDVRVKFSGGNIYEEKVRYSEEFSENSVATYEINGDILTVSKSNNEIYHYLIADIVLISAEEDGNQDELFNALGNDFLFEDKSASVKVLVSEFFSSEISG